MALRFVLLCAGLSLVLAVPHDHRQKRFLTDTGVTGNCLVGHQNCHHCGTYTMISGEYLCCAECDDSIMTSPSGTGGIHCQCISNSPPTDFSPEH